MKMRKVIRVLIRIFLGLAALALLLVGIGMFPGRIEAIYPGMGLRCMCDGAHFMQFRDGKVILSSSNHPPGILYGRYETNPDGLVDVYTLPFHEGEAEELIYRATPRMWFTRFGKADGTSAGWFRKGWITGIVATTIRDQEISYSIVKKDGTFVRTSYSSSLSELRTETKPPRKVKAEPAAPSEGDKHPN